jgi:hypothetical protein
MCPYAEKRLEHLARSVWGMRYQGNWFVMLSAYFDECQAVTEEVGNLMFVGGWIADVSKWDRFEVDWKLFLAAYDIPYLHMSEFAHHVGPYEKWKDKDGTRRNFLNDAAAIIRETVQRGFVCCVSQKAFDDFDGFYDLRSTFSSSYALTGRSCAALAAEWQKRNSGGKNSEIRYVFEDGEGDKGGLMRAMADVIPAMPNPIFEPGRDHKPSEKWPEGRKGLVHLQAADFLAYERGKIGRDGRRIANGTQKLRSSMQVLPNEKVDSVFLDSERLAFICRVMKIPKRHVLDSSHANAKGKTPQ